MNVADTFVHTVKYQQNEEACPFFIYQYIPLYSSNVSKNCKCGRQRQWTGGLGHRLAEDCYFDPYLLSYVDSIFMASLVTSSGSWLRVYCLPLWVVTNIASARAWLWFQPWLTVSTGVTCVYIIPQCQRVLPVCDSRDLITPSYCLFLWQFLCFLRWILCRYR